MSTEFDLRNFFPELDGFAHKGIFDGAARPWDVLPKIHGYILAHFPAIGGEALPAGIERNGDALFCTGETTLKQDLDYRPLHIFIGAGTKIEPAAYIKGPALIGRKCEIRQAAYLRGDLIAGDHCTLGHTSEIKNSILMNHTEAGHFNYIGDSVLGSYVNLGAGTKIANLKFRSPEAKKAISFPEITFVLNGETVRTDIAKFGAIIGDHCELGCNSVTSPAALLEEQCWVYPNTTLPSGYYPKKSFIRPKNLKPEIGKR